MRKILVRKALIMFLFVSLISSNVILRSDRVTAEQTGPLDGGFISVDSNYGDPSTIRVKCFPTNLNEIDVGQYGDTVTVQVDYEIRCEGYWDHAYIDISFVEGGGTDSFDTGNSLAQGSLTISKFMSPGTNFNVKLHARFYDGWPTQELRGEDTAYTVGSTHRIVCPIADFSYTPSNPNTDNIVYFTDLSVDTDGTIVSWLWNFGDGVTSTNRNPSHQYSHSGIYTVTLRAWDNDDCYSDSSKSITMKQKPIVNFSYSPSAPTTVEIIQFYDNSYDNDGTMTSWIWDFGDGTSSTDQSPTHQYTTNGTYTVSLQVTDNDGLAGRKTKSITVKIKPIADFSYTPQSPKPGDTIQFTDLSYDPDGRIVSWSWDFGDQIRLSTQNPAHKYVNDGKYKVILLITDNDGFTATKIINISVKINQLPNADFAYSPSAPTTDDTIQFTDHSTDIDGTITVWSWDFGDSSTSTIQNPTHKYTNSGTYSVSLQVTDDDGASKSKSISVTVKQNIKPKANFTYSASSPKVNESIQFTDGSQDPDGTIVAWSWNFGDGKTSTIKSPTHTYTKVGTYQVSLQVTDNNGAVHSKTTSIVIAKTPGFELILVISAIALVFLWKRKRT